MPDRKYKIGDSVWFKFDNGKKEQKGVIQWHGDICGYQILGNVDSKVYFVKEDEISGIAPHKRVPVDGKKCSNCRWCDKCIDEHPCSICDGFNHTRWQPKVKNVEPNNDTPCCSKCKFHDRGVDQWPCDNCRDYSQFESKWLDPKPNDASDPYRYIREYLGNNSSWGIAQPTKLLGLNINEIYFDDILKEDNNMKKKQQNQRRRNRNEIRGNGKYSRDINEIIFNGPATIIKWKPSMEQWASNKKGDKTVAVCGKDDEFDKTTGFLLAIIKEFFDNQSYDNILRKIDSFKEDDKKSPSNEEEWDTNFKFGKNDDDQDDLYI